MRLNINRLEATEFRAIQEIGPDFWAFVSVSFNIFCPSLRDRPNLGASAREAEEHARDRGREPTRDHKFIFSEPLTDQY